MAPEENKNGSFEYFDEQELDDSESFFRTPDQQVNAALKHTNRTVPANRRSNKSASRA